MWQPSRNPTGFYTFKRPILSSQSTPRRRPQRTIRPWKRSEGRRVSRSPILLRLNDNCQSGVRKPRRCALGVYMCHTKGVLANLINPTQEDRSRIAEDFRCSNRSSFVRPILPNPTRRRYCWSSLFGMVEGMPSCPCFHILDFLKGWASRSMFRSFFFLSSSKLFSCKKNADIVSFQQLYAMSDVNKPLFAADQSTGPQAVARLRWVSSYMLTRSFCLDPRRVL